MLLPVIYGIHPTSKWLTKKNTDASKIHYKKTKIKISIHVLSCVFLWYPILPWRWDIGTCECEWGVVSSTKPGLLGITTSPWCCWSRLQKSGIWHVGWSVVRWLHTWFYYNGLPEVGHHLCDSWPIHTAWFNTHYSYFCYLPHALHVVVVVKSLVDYIIDGPCS